MNVKQAVSVKKIGDDAEALFRGGFFLLRGSRKFHEI